MSKTKYQELNDYWKENGDAADAVVFKNLDEPQEFDNREQYEAEKLQKQQTAYLKNQWKRGDRQIIEQKMHNEHLRLPMYIDYDIMANHEIIGRALEIYVEETLVLNERGNLVNVVSKNKKTQSVIEALLNSGLSVHTNLPIWTYEMLKKGDCFVHYQVSDIRGIVGTKTLPTAEIQRVEGAYHQFLTGGGGRFSNDEVYFNWLGAENINFKHWTVGHFRLMLNETRLPYGLSILEKCRRVWKNLILAEDAMLSMQLLRGVDRLVYNVEVGNLDPDDVTPYLDELANRFKRKIKVDPQTGQMDLKHNILGLDQDIFMLKRDGKGSSVEKLEGQSNMDTSVVDHQMKKLMAALGIPLTYLSYSETAGEGKSLAMQDIRFAKTVIRIQQAILLELNKAVTTHLILLGMEDEIDNFSLTMNNPSKQTEILRLEIESQKIDLYNAAIDNASGIAAFSSTEAKKRYLGLTDDEILSDIKRIRIESAVRAELDTTAEVIPKSGIFDDVDAIYGSSIGGTVPAETEDGEFGGGGGGGASGGGSFGGDLGSDLGGGDDLGGEEATPAEGENADADIGGEEDLNLTDNMEERVRKSLDKINKILYG